MFGVKDSAVGGNRLHLLKRLPGPTSLARIVAAAVLMSCFGNLAESRLTHVCLSHCTDECLSSALWLGDSDLSSRSAVPVGARVVVSQTRRIHKAVYASDVTFCSGGGLMFRATDTADEVASKLLSRPFQESCTPAAPAFLADYVNNSNAGTSSCSVTCFGSLDPGRRALGTNVSSCYEQGADPAGWLLIPLPTILPTEIGVFIDNATDSVLGPLGICLEKETACSMTTSSAYDEVAAIAAGAQLPETAVTLPVPWASEGCSIEDISQMIDLRCQRDGSSHVITFEDTVGFSSLADNNDNRSCHFTSIVLNELLRTWGALPDQLPGVSCLPIQGLQSILGSASCLSSRGTVNAINTVLYRYACISNGGRIIGWGDSSVNMTDIDFLRTAPEAGTAGACTVCTSTTENCNRTNLVYCSPYMNTFKVVVDDSIGEARSCQDLAFALTAALRDFSHHKFQLYNLLNASQVHITEPLPELQFQCRSDGPTQTDLILATGGNMRNCYDQLGGLFAFLKACRGGDAEFRAAEEIALQRSALCLTNATSVVFPCGGANAALLVSAVNHVLSRFWTFSGFSQVPTLPSSGTIVQCHNDRLVVIGSLVACHDVVHSLGAALDAFHRNRHWWCW